MLYSRRIDLRQKRCVPGRNAVARPSGPYQLFPAGDDVTISGDQIFIVLHNVDREKVFNLIAPVKNGANGSAS